MSYITNQNVSTIKMYILFLSPYLELYQVYGFEHIPPSGVTKHAKKILLLAYRIGGSEREALWCLLCTILIYMLNFSLLN